MRRLSRKGKSFRSPSNIARRLKVLPLAARKTTSWARFVYNYAIGLRPRKPYVFRNGARVQLGRALDHAALIEIFLREDYGPIRDNSIIIDVGANIGGFSVYAIGAARNVRVFAYEPWPPYFAVLRENVALNQQNGSVEYFNLAVAATAAARPLYIAGPGLLFPTFAPKFEAAAGRAEVVPCTTIGEILAAHNLANADLLKLDCEGAEYEILLRMPIETLRKFRELRFEHHELGPGHPNVEQLTAHLRSAGFIIIHEKRISSTTGMLWARRADSMRPT